MWLQRRDPKLPRRSPRTLLLVEELEKRELLSGFSPPASAHGLLPNNQPLTLANQSWRDGPQSLTSLLPTGTGSGPIQKPPANAKTPVVQIPLVVGPNQNSSPTGEGYTPAQMQQAYGFNHITLPAGKTFDDAGKGQTIAIIDVLDDPNITSDLQTFDETFNIGGSAHDPTSTGFFKVVNESGGSTLPPPDNGEVDYGLETSLDVEWAHAMAPGANILLVEANSFAFADLDMAIEFAAQQPHVSVISMSFGGGEWPAEYYSDNIFTTPAGHQGVSFVASAGDSGGSYPENPAISPNVLSVGGTTLPADASGNPNRALESAWTSGGGGISSYEAEPAYQLGVQSTGSRTGPDLAYDSDQTTGVAVYDTLYANAAFPGKPWFKVGGTSIAAPQISSLVAIADQLRVAAHESTLDGPNQLLPAIYQIAAGDPHAFQDITSGNNGHAAGPGYDFATGLGTPNAQYLVPDLVNAYATPPAPRTLYWTGDVNSNWNTPGNWSTVDPTVKNVQQFVLPTAADRVVVDLTGATILHDTTRYDTISSFTVTAPKVTLDLGAGTLDLSGNGGRGTFQADQNGDTVTLEAGVLAHADVTSHTALSATSATVGYLTELPDLVGVQLDGTLNANQSGQNNGFYFTSGLVLNGTINLGGNKDLSSVLMAGYYDGYLGNQDNNPETISGSGTIQLGQSQNDDALYNWGTLGTFTIGPGITVRGGGSGSIGLFEQTNGTGGLDNQGTLQANGGTLVIESSSPSLYGYGPPTAPGWTNEGTITATGGAILGLLGDWINFGKISVDSRSTVLLGNPTAGQLASDPGAFYNSWSSSGSVTIADGATVYLGGFLTADQYQGATAIPGVSMHPAADVRLLDGTVDNSAANNPVSRGVLNAAASPLVLAGGTITGGNISAGSKVQVVTAAPLPSGGDVWGTFTTFEAAGGQMDNVANAGTLTATAATLTLSNVTNSGTVSGNTGAVIEFLNIWANTGTIKVDGTSSLYLGNSASSDPNFPPTLVDGSPYAWNPAAGSIQVADGATVGLGGLLTTDQFMAFPNLPNVSIHPAHDTVLLDGWLDNNPVDNPVTHGVLALTSATGPLNLAGGLISGGTITSTGTGALDVVGFGGPLYLYDGFLDSVANDATIAVSHTVLLLEGTTVNNGNMTASSGGIFALPGGSFTNNGTIDLSSGGASLLSPVTNTGTISLSAGSLYVAGTMTNIGTISASSHSDAEFHGNYDNSHGTISVDSTSGLLLGRSTLDQLNFPTIADGSPYAYDPSKVGAIQIADGGTFVLGGLLTTDQWNAFPSLPGVSINLAKDQIALTGWLDNSPADNPISGGVMAITSATGLLYLDGGYIYQGKITTSGPDDLEARSVGVLDNVELDGNLNVTGPYGFGEIYVENNMTLNGTIEMPEGEGELLVGYFDNSADTISGTGTISMGTSQTYQSVVDNLSNNSLTFGPGITISAGAQYADLVSQGSQINVEGTVEDNTATSTLYTYGENFNTFTVFQDLANLNGGTLTGGTWEFGNGATWRTDGADITTNAANLSISGAGTQILDAIFTQGNNALAGLTTNTATGHLTVGAGYNLTTQGAFQNNGILEIGGTVSVQGNYTQTAGAALDIDIASASVYGTLAVSGTATLDGTLNVALLNGYTPAPGASFTILTFGTRSGDFSAENGLNFSPSEYFMPEYLDDTLTLAVE
jgi:hypothetical protein